ncbi:hypothetical protein HCJ66_06950 [Listeria sp. FSL L7-1582]|uniref:beta family protein n=1 Tax=Listeria portnoyi TaxID=2713504 RepID=UPI00164D8477|nr:hypothetical protein [Listeria portnoyi]MBC6309290.1 hypothetical protein [Listeria portnoyi]
MTIYYPLLKKGNSEVKALEEVWKHSSPKNLVPIIESQRKNNPSKWEKDFNTLGKYMKSRFGDHIFAYQFSTTFADIDPDVTKNWQGKNSENIVEFMHTKLAEHHNNFFPCISFDEKDWIIDTLSKYDHTQIIIRIEPYKFDSGIDQFMFQGILEKFEKIFPHSELIFLLDFYNKIIDLTRINKLVDFLTQNNKQVVFGATSCPMNSDDVSYSSFSVAAIRNDFSTFLTLKKSYPNLNFSDYTVRLKPEPTTEEKREINMNNTYLKIFYTTEKDYMIGKSGLLKKQKSDAEHISINDICNMIVDSEHFKGKDFSYGDLKIFECANNNFEINDHQVPIRLGINHHIHTILNQL